MKAIRQWLIGAMVVLVGGQITVADDKKKADETPAAQFAALQKEYRDAQQAFSKKYQEATTDEERLKIAQELYPRPEKFVGRFLEIAQAAPDDPVAVDCLVFVVQNAYHLPQGSAAIQTLMKSHVESPKLAPVCQMMAYVRTDDAKAFLEAVLERNSSRDVQGSACYSLAKLLSDQAPAEAEKMLERVKQEFADVAGGRGTLGESAERDLYELRFLSIGKPAPEIEGEDIEGVPFKLSDYRGKVVVLDFWGHW